MLQNEVRQSTDTSYVDDQSAEYYKVDLRSFDTHYLTVMSLIRKFYDMQIIKDAAVISCGEKQKYLVMLDLKSESLTGITNIDQIQIPKNEKSGLDLYRPDNCYTPICYAGGYYLFASIVKCKLVACSVAEKTFKKLADIRYCNDTGNLTRPGQMAL